MVVGTNEFVFPTPISVYVKPNARTYHYHIFVPSISAFPNQIQTSTANDFSTADYEFWARRLETTRNGLHPIGQVAQYTLYGNGRYVAVHEPLTNAPSKLEFLSHKLVLPPGYECTFFSQYGEIVAIGAEKRSSSNSARFLDGKVFLWDPTTASTYSRFANVPSGSPFSGWTADGLLYYIVNGKIKAYAGDLPATIHDFPGTDVEFSDASSYLINYPYMATNRNEISIVGYPSETNIPTAEVAVYSYGQNDKNHPQSFGIDCYISTGTHFWTSGNNLRIGMVQTFGDSTYITWRDDSQTAGQRYGVDVIDNSSDPVALASVESLIFDGNLTYKAKGAVGVIVTFATLPAGASVTAKYKRDREDNWHYGTPVTSASADPRQAKVMWGLDWREVEFGFDSTATTITPKITGIFWIYDDRSEHKDF